MIGDGVLLAFCRGRLLGSYFLKRLKTTRYMEEKDVVFGTLSKHAGLEKTKPEIRTTLRSGL